MLDTIQLDNILFLDIETVPETEHFSDLDSDFQELFAHKTQYQRKEDVSPEEFYERAGIWAEFGKIICISVGYFTQKKGERQFRVTTFQGDEERLLLDFSNLLNNHFIHTFYKNKYYLKIHLHQIVSNTFYIWFNTYSLIHFLLKYLL